ncbi:MAG: guanine deaminase [Proteobacteria bacterium]|nr:guanine deaminase [Pseudomonadota bacterium]MDA1237640.1 guanine deaminase [Pseudomonadota bacterium]
MISQTKVLLGQTLSFNDNPLVNGLKNSYSHETNGMVVIKDGIITDVGSSDTIHSPKNATIVDYGQDLILAGFIDSHLHYPQTAIISSWGRRLIDWLNEYTFPEEERFFDHDYAIEIANRYFDIALSNGVTTSVSYGTTHPESVNAFFSVAKARGLRALTGKTCMDRNAPENLMDNALLAYEQSKALIQKWHKVDRLEYVITPRFAPTSSPEQLLALGALWKEYPDCLMQTHISEQIEEIEWVKKLFPQAKDYLDTYEASGLIGSRSLFGHAIHLNEREISRLTEIGSSIAHCPTSNTFIGSGLFDLSGLSDKGLNIGLATDIGGGSSFSMLRVMAAAYEIGQLRGDPMHPAHLLWLSTCGSAKALHLNHKIGNLVPGMEADIVVLDLKSTPEIKQRAERSNDIWDLIFPTIMMGDDRAVRDTWIAGEKWGLIN